MKFFLLKLLCWGLSNDTDRSSTHQRRQSFEKHDGCVDDVNDIMGFHSTSKPIEESDSHLIHSPLPSKSQGVCERVSNPYFYDDYLQTMAVYKGIKEGNGAFIWEHTQSHPQAQGQSTTFSLPNDLYNLNSKYSVEESDFLKVSKVDVEDHKYVGKHVDDHPNARRHAGKDDDVEDKGGGCELSLSLSLHHPSSQSEISSSSEALSLVSGSNYKDCSGTSLCTLRRGEGNSAKEVLNRQRAKKKEKRRKEIDVGVERADCRVKVLKCEFVVLKWALTVLEESFHIE
ncbi:myb family transcription factor APL [Gossypium australe]|uniref:Myb family transcription factor APL n=1 Tax=Gossypium australe TaxID=47621 RepID=A0A5B6VAS0_9ROSI|nr:myb family transcription factor APL [Gossypium australe]